MAAPELPPASSGAVPLVPPAPLPQPEPAAHPLPEPAAPQPPQPAPEPAESSVPRLLRDSAGWVWRLGVLAIGGFGLVWLLDKLYLLVLPLIGALFVSALLRPLVQFFRRRGLPRALATWTTVLIGFAILGGVLFFVVTRVEAESGTLATSLTHVVEHLRNVLIHDFRISPNSINGLETKITDYINKHGSTLAAGVLSGVLVVGEAVTGAVLAFFICFFLLYDGDHIWGWLVHLFPVRQRSRIHEAGEEAWSRIGGWVRGTFFIAVFHAVVVSVTLALLGAPLVVPLGLLVFLGSFIPLVGSVLFGGLAALVTLVELGLVPALILVGVLVVDNQIEAHLLQPFLVGRYVRLHPLAVVLVIAAGGFLQGLPGAIIALPFTSAVFAAAQSLQHTAARTKLDVPPEAEPSYPDPP